MSDKILQKGGDTMKKNCFNESIKKYIDKNGNTVKNYKNMCEILGEQITSGVAKQNQLERWKIYFDYNKIGHRFEITRIYDEATTRENEKQYFNKKKSLKLFARSLYRKELVAILLYIIKKSDGSHLWESKLNLAIKCGLMNEHVKGKVKYKDYTSYRSKIKKTEGQARYLSVNMYKHFYCLFSQSLKKGVYNVINSALEAMQELEIITCNTIYVGLKEKEFIPLSINEIIKYKQIENKVLEEIYPEYAIKVSSPKKQIRIKDLMYFPNLIERFYEGLSELINKQMNYKMVLQYYDIYITDEGFELSNAIKDENDFESIKQHLNETYVDNVYNRENEKIRKYKRQSNDIETEFKVGNKELAMWYQIKQIAYYNKIELLDQFINCNDPIDAIIIDDEYPIISEEDSKKSAVEILNELNIQTKKIKEDEIAIKEDLFNEILESELEIKE